MAQIKARAKTSGDAVQVKVLMQHPMETGLRKDKKTGKKIPAHHITEVTISSGDKMLVKANYGPAVSKNPYLSMHVKGPKSGDKLNIAWVDNQGKNASAEVTVK